MPTSYLVGLDRQQSEVVGPIPVRGPQIAQRRKTSSRLERLRCCSRSQQRYAHQSRLHKAHLGPQDTTRQNGIWVPGCERERLSGAQTVTV